MSKKIPDSYVAEGVVQYEFSMASLGVNLQANYSEMEDKECRWSKNLIWR